MDAADRRVSQLAELVEAMSDPMVTEIILEVRRIGVSQACSKLACCSGASKRATDDDDPDVGG